MPSQLSGPTFKIMWLFNQGYSGWSETMYWVANGVTNPLVAAVADARTYVKARLPLMASFTYCAGIRLTQILGVAAPKTTILTGEDVPAVAGQLPNAEYPSKAWYARLEDGDVVYRRFMWLRGMSNLWNSYDPASQASPVINDTLRTPFKVFRNLFEPDTVPLQGRFAIRARTKDLTDRREFTLSLLNLSADNCRWIISSDDPLGYDLGDEVMIQRSKGCGTKGANGAGKIVKVIPPGNGLPETYEVDWGPKCCGPVLWKPRSGKVIKAPYRYFAIRFLALERIGTKKVGRAFFGTRGRQSRGRC